MKRFAVILLLLHAPAAADDLRVLCLGNSITLHAPAPEIGWTGNWGMAASAADRDYVHLVSTGLEKETGRRPAVRVRNIADFERGPAAYDPSLALAGELHFRPEIVIVAVGENTGELATPEAEQAFAGGLDRLLGAFKNAGHPAIFVRSCFWPHSTRDRLLREAAARAGVAFVDIGAIGRDPANAARAEREIAHAGVAGHPGDRGMRAIADALLKAIRQQRTGGEVLRGEAETELAPHGGGNVYAPDVVRDGDRWLMYYGAQGRDGHDRIHLAESPDGFSWIRRGVVLDCDTANHVNDPSVVRVGDLWWMFYTVAQIGELDEIAAATSRDGLTWEKRGVVLSRGAGTAWDSGKVGRPSVLRENGRFRLWYDGQPTAEAAAADETAKAVRAEGRAVGHAESQDGLTWRRLTSPVFREGAGAVQVVRHGDRYLMVIESGSGVRMAVSRDGLAWRAGGLLAGLSGGESDRFGMVTPALVFFPDRAMLFHGAAARRTWDGNAIAVRPVTLSKGGDTP